MIKIYTILFIFIFNIVSTSIISQSTACAGTQIGSLAYGQLTAINNTTNTVNLSSNLNTNFVALSDKTCGARVQNAKMLLKFDVGEDYEFGSTPWNISFNIEVKVFSGSTEFFTSSSSIQINQNQPEQLFIIDYPNLCYLHFALVLGILLLSLNLDELPPCFVVLKTKPCRK